MKKISQKGLDKLTKGKGWELSPDSKKAVLDRDKAAMKSKQVQAIANLSESVDGIRDALGTDTAKDYTTVLNKLVESIKGITVPLSAVPAETSPDKNWRFIVKRNSEGMISEIEATGE